MFQQAHPTKWYVPHSVEGTEQVQTAKLRGVVFQSYLTFMAHVDPVLKLCSQRIFMMKKLRDQGLPLSHVHTIFKHWS